MTRCKLKDSAMNKKYWAEEIKTAAYVRNSIDNELNKEKSPYEAPMKQEPDIVMGSSDQLP